MGHSMIWFTVTSSSIMNTSRFSEQLLKCWVPLGPLLRTGIYWLVPKSEEHSASVSGVTEWNAGDTMEENVPEGQGVNLRELEK
jgi:hypothetical protein